MKTIIRSLAVAMALAAPFAATGALAHARLVNSTPAKDSAGASPSMIMLTFSEKVEGKLSGFAVTGPDGKAVDLPVSVAGGGTVLHAMPAKPLAAGAYKIAWHAVTDDGHRTEGTLTFTVK